MIFHFRSDWMDERKVIMDTTTFHDGMRLLIDQAKGPKINFGTMITSIREKGYYVCEHTLLRYGRRIIFILNDNRAGNRKNVVLRWTRLSDAELDNLNILTNGDYNSWMNNNDLFGTTTDSMTGTWLYKEGRQDVCTPEAAAEFMPNTHYESFKRNWVSSRSRGGHWLNVRRYCTKIEVNITESNGRKNVTLDSRTKLRDNDYIVLFPSVGN